MIKLAATYLLIGTICNPLQYPLGYSPITSASLLGQNVLGQILKALKVQFK